MPYSYDTWEPAFECHLRADAPSVCEDVGRVLDLWNRDRRVEFARYLYHGRFSALDAIRERSRRVAPVKAIMDGFLKLPSMLSGVYWTEFLKIRDGFFEEYDNAVREHADNVAQAPKRIHERLRDVLDGDLARRDLASAVERALEGSVCALCFERPKDACLVHGTARGCALCRACAARIRTERCPFCRAPITAVLKIC